MMIDDMISYTYYLIGKQLRVTLETEIAKVHKIGKLHI